MLSYQHQYHAGNHGDVLKHWLLIETILYMQKKEKPFDYIDTHAGAGFYALHSHFSRKTGEAEQGVLKLDWTQLPGLKNYYQQIQVDLGAWNYPGSPALVNQMLRRDDRSWLFEMHPQTFDDLKKHCQKRKRTFIEQQDGFQGVIRLLPTTSRRALVLMDPSYEVKTDYQTVLDVINKASKKMPQTVFLLWYPVVDRSTIDQMEKKIINKTELSNVHLFEMGIDDDEKPGMTASGIIAVNPPWTLKDTFAAQIENLSAQLAVDGKSRWRYQCLVEEK
ncbi:23S rRNA (adenine(2030)-N(6))-methyltransferase RlmJ [Teredinibacter sp. KSP-S5-2]|uniref:23S rRNA (adenine(2030)-N(6))-methyltransferase RlmJ n=1 Tax=Teredinibacter sp. KSP-S5-2 TaxID=3034506 RepID=UPI002934CCB1|nr:23S rRNA (adenine(2030)-N(6))-methyltransferase RlmJ [Teredinibacter sp. KSP-S5-2]WNO08333.1 23S rRNA (adenine(2030)-N(6))-methyltransferase RlmJ [Teredinibacter sp. KSP-S5-2]